MKQPGLQMQLIYSMLICVMTSAPICTGANPSMSFTADCESESGTMAVLLQEACSTESIDLQHDGTNVKLAAGDSLRYIAHTSSDHVLGTVLAILDHPSIRMEDGPFECEQVYFVSAVVGQWSGDRIDLFDPCLDVSLGQPIRFLCAPNIDAGPDQSVCDFIFDVTATSSNGTGVWRSLDPYVVVSSLVDITARVWVNDPGVYRLEFSSGHPPCVARDTMIVEVSETSSYILRQSIDRVCNLSEDSFYVAFDIFEGDAGATTVSGPGTLQGGHFTSDWLPAGSNYEFVVSDLSDCGADTLSGYFDCSCLSEVGNLRNVHLRICDLDTFEAAEYYEPTGQVIAGDDIRNFILTTSEDQPFEHIVNRNRLGQFVFDTGQLDLSATYYVYIVIGRQGNSGFVDLDDPCLKIAGPVSVGWYETPKNTRIDANNPEINCDFPEVRLQAVTSNDTNGYTYQWMSLDSGVIDLDEQGRPSIHVSTPGRYCVRFGHVDALCSAEDTIVVTRSGELPVVHAAQSDLITCYQDTVGLTGVGSSTGDRFVYEWEGPGLISDVHQLEVLVNSIGLYALTVRDTVLDCVSIEKLVVEDDRVHPVVVTDVSSTLGCGNDHVVVSAVGSDIGLYYEYDWVITSDTGHISNALDQQNIEVDLPGIYRLSISNVLNGCSSHVDAEVRLNENRIGWANIEAMAPTCEDGEDGRIAVQEVSGGVWPYEYSIDGGETYFMDSSLTQLLPGIYPIVVREQTGCTYEDTVTLTAPAEFYVELGVDQEIKFGEKLTLSGVTNLADSLMRYVVWTPQLDSFSQDPFLQVGFPPLGRQTYELTISDLNGCVESDVIQVDVLFERRLYVPNAIRPNSSNLSNRYLNLFADPIMVTAINRFEVYDRWGNCVHKRGSIPVSLDLDEENAWDGYINGKAAPTGSYTYFAEVEFVNGRTEVVKGVCQLVE